MKETIIKNRMYSPILDPDSNTIIVVSLWKSAEDIEFKNGSTLESKLGAIKGITQSTTVSGQGYVFDAKTLIDKINSLKNASA